LPKAVDFDSKTAKFQFGAMPDRPRSHRADRSGWRIGDKQPGRERLCLPARFSGDILGIRLTAPTFLPHRNGFPVKIACSPVAWRPITLAAVFALLGTVAIACQVPVFRYAIERWPADKYEIVVLHKGPLSEADQKRVEKLRQSDHKSPLSANFQVGTMELGELQDPLLKQIVAQKGDGEQSLVAILYPRNAQEVPDRVVDVMPLGEVAIDSVADSPLRREVVKRLCEGDSAVWIFVPSGHADQDAVALKTLKQEVQRNQQELKLPPQDELEADELFNQQTNIELRLSFSIVTLDRQDPKEQFLLRLLMESEPDLASLDQPMAFPVLGRGRVLYALVGKGIYEDTIAIASSFIVGPCSCQVKEQNPGFDLLMAVDWDDKVGVNALSKPLPEKSAAPIKLTIPPGK
jgi:hypothetical protein